MWLPNYESWQQLPLSLLFTEQHLKVSIQAEVLVPSTLQKHRKSGVSLENLQCKALIQWNTCFAVHSHKCVCGEEDTTWVRIKTTI